ncbi:MULTISPECIES: ATP-binding protein [unclassified Treponema]|uniref:ATP-binding protein n=1 Tax=unclassified Treponema TaxID=2638727 RepID=UPI0020A5CB3F|nr:MULTISPECIES: ATP-binding protein [unclassified Treponema]UTC66540.1 putative DNA binding domain-containing protein [Treponema sp. OMZ 789]UTC69272.1 putative DNA binding domain-containing protein [Treponema sp. OMZ 790]UTC71986.1 putative DNA binding domain-containing protein [Treponema sp. OMZ 791]
MEDYNKEFKIDIPKKQSALKAEIVSFLNSTDGEIYLGVDDSGTVHYDLINEKKKKWEEVLSNWIVNAFTPGVTSLIYIYPNETPFRIKIFKGKERPYFYKDGEGFNTKGVYVRVGSTKRLASFDEIQRMIRQNSQNDYERLLCHRDDLTFNYIENRFKEKSVPFDKYALSLMDKNGEYNNAALLLSDQNPTISKFAVFQGTTVNVFLDKKEFTGSILKQLDEVLYFANLSNRKKITITGNPERDEYSDIPERALREAIVNCYCHRDWTLSGDIKIEFYDDRVQIFSPGSLPDGLTLENIKMGMVAKRNKIIVDTLDKADVIENYASGVRRIFEDYAGFKKQPEYYISDNGVIVTLFNRNYDVQDDGQNDVQDDGQNDGQDDGQNDGQNDGQKINSKDRLEKIIKYIESDKNMTADRLKDLLNVSKRTIERDIEKLRKDNKIEYVGSAKEGYWIVKRTN